MKVIVQRVEWATVIIDNVVFNEIKQGFLLLVGFTHGDTAEIAKEMARKISLMRVFEDCNQKLNLSIKDIDGSILSISQFTLYADTKKGNRPSFTDSMPFTQAKEFYELFNNFLEKDYQITTKSGKFGSHMKLNFINDGPVTIILES